MTKIFLIRHGWNDFIGHKIAGRLPGVHLNAEGRVQADRLVERLRPEGIQRIFSSPLERCRETASRFAAAARLTVEILPSVLEIDYGDWTGKSIAELQKQPLWTGWNNHRTQTRIPNGETMLEIQSRMVAEMQRLRSAFPNETIAVFSHGDPIRAVICFALGIPLDFLQRLEISPASVSLLCMDEASVKVQYVNDLSAGPV